MEDAWEKALTELAAAEAELARREQARPRTLSTAERAAVLAFGFDLESVWDAATTSDKDRKQLLRTLLEEVNITVHRDDVNRRRGNTSGRPCPSDGHGHEHFNESREPTRFVSMSRKDRFTRSETPSCEQ